MRVTQAMDGEPILHVRNLGVHISILLTCVLFDLLTTRFFAEHFSYIELSLVYHKFLNQSHENAQS